MLSVSLNSEVVTVTDSTRLRGESFRELSRTADININTSPNQSISIKHNHHVTVTVNHAFSRIRLFLIPRADLSANTPINAAPQCHQTFKPES